MKIFLGLLFFIGALFAYNPPIYAALGDKIYDNVPKIQKLKTIPQYEMFSQKIDAYLADVEKTKALGFAIESGESDDKKGYLKRLRELAKMNDFFQRSARSLFEKSMKTKDFDLFVRIIDTGLIDTSRRKKEIMDFYKKYKDQIDLDGELARLVKEEEAKERPKYSAEYYKKLKEQQEREKIERLREKDRKRQEALQKKLEEELKRKKRQIQAEQIRELQKDLP